MNPSWLDTTMYPFTFRSLQTDGGQLHYIDEGQGPVVLFVHGTPSWSFEFRDVIKSLSGRYRCIAVDHMGFGLSDKPANYAYTLDSHKRNLQALIAHLQLQHFTIVVHDFGGPIGLSVAADMPERIDSLILANTWCFSVEQEPEFKRMRAILGSPLLPFLYKYFNFSAKYILPAAFGEKSRLTKEIHQHYLRPFGKASERQGTIGFARALLRDQAWFEAVGRALGRLQNTPALILWGMQDTFVTEKFLDKVNGYFPRAEVVRYPDAGHFVLEEKSVLATAAIEQFLRKVYP